MVQSKKLLVKESHVIIEHDEEDNILYTSWIGFQKPEKIIASGKEILNIYKDLNCSKLFNDNSEVTGPWNGAAEWVRDEYFPKMIEYGMKQFAWVMSPSIFAEVSAKKSMMETDVIKTFKDRDKALEWLRTGGV